MMGQVPHLRQRTTSKVVSLQFLRHSYFRTPIRARALGIAKNSVRQAWASVECSVQLRAEQRDPVLVQVMT
jgi:hypothetical protein